VLQANKGERQIMSDTKHSWRFFRAGGFDQVRLDTGADLANLSQLDQKLWVALACPVRGLEFDTRTLELLDTDKDGRIRVPEILAAVNWTCSMLKDPDVLAKPSESLALASINDATPEGKQLLASATQILVNLGKKDASAISVADTTDTARIFAETQFNGDGIVPVESAGDDANRAVIVDIIACLGAETDRSGKPGISQGKVDAFFAEAAAYSEWWKKAESDAATVLPLGERTAEAVDAFRSIKPKVDDYFARCRLAAFDSRAMAALNRQESEYLALAAKDLTITASEIAGFPLARIEANKPLPLKEALNPAHAGAVAVLHSAVIKPIFGDKSTLTADEWVAICTKLGAYEGWFSSKAGAVVEKLGIKRVREILAGKSKDVITALIAKDKALEPEANSIALVDKLARFQRDLYVLLNNFVSFRDFYTRRAKAVFQVGTLYLDGRSCDLCVRVDDTGKHAALAGLAKSYLAYCDCTRPSGEKMTIAAAFTGGDSDNLMLGRNGVFYDRKGRDWDATITKVIDNPISIRQAFWSPYKKFVRLLEDQVAKRAAAADVTADAKLAAVASSVAQADKTKPVEPKKMDIGTVAALGVGVGAVSTVIGGFLSGFIKLGLWMPLGVIGLLLLISGPSMLIAWLKLRQRNLGPILDANGWAVNTRARVNVPFGGALTGVATLPPGSERSFEDPFADKKIRWGLYLFYLFLAGFLTLVGLWYFGKLDNALPSWAESTSVLGTNAPAWKKVVVPVTTPPTNAPAK
jgi:hypothetical protein